jgi:hypothetical protein
LTPSDTAPDLLDRVADVRGSRPTNFSPTLFFAVGRADADALEILAERALRLADAHAVVVEESAKAAFERAGVVETFESQAVDDGGIADDGDDVAGLRIDLIAPRHADGGADGGAGMADGEKVVGDSSGLGIR